MARKSETLSDSPAVKHEITATVSVKKRRGRPPVGEPKVMAAFRDLYPHVTTDRARRNKYYVARAFVALFEDGRDEQSTQKYSSFTDSGRNYRQAILVELGRMAVAFGDEVARKIADQMLARGTNYTTVETVAWLRGRARAKERRPPTHSMIRTARH